MNVAFYAPMKPPAHPNPSGDRQIARAFVAALEAGGHQVELASTLRSREARGCRARQRRIEAVAERARDRLLRRFARRAPAQRPDIWFTYHLYHKAPDFLGPAIAKTLGIPYLVAEASFAPKQQDGPWAEWHEQVRRAIEQAAALVIINSDDVAGLAPLLGARQRMVRLAPFIDDEPYRHGPRRHVLRARIAQEYGLPEALPWLLTVAMMRPGRKADSYILLARALAGLSQRSWCLLAAGDGEAGARVRAAFSSLVPQQVGFLGRLAPERLPDVYRASDLFVWPALGEPLGLVFLEAQAAGLAVVAGGGRGVPDLVADGRTGLLSAPGDVEGLRQHLGEMIDDPERRQTFARAAVAHVHAHHGIGAAARRLDALLHEIAAGSNA